jgi:hypothetical protein
MCFIGTSHFAVHQLASLHEMKTDFSSVIAFQDALAAISSYN